MTGSHQTVNRNYRYQNRHLFEFQRSFHSWSGYFQFRHPNLYLHPLHGRKLLRLRYSGSLFLQLKQPQNSFLHSSDSKRSGILPQLCLLQRHPAMNRLPRNRYGVLLCRLYDPELMHCCCPGVLFHKDKLPSCLLCTVFLGLATNLKHVEQSNHGFHNLGEKGQRKNHRYSNLVLTPHMMQQVNP